jgi:hypothetical protein
MTFGANQSRSIYVLEETEAQKRGVTCSKTLRPVSDCEGHLPLSKVIEALFCCIAGGRVWGGPQA